MLRQEHHTPISEIPPDRFHKRTLPKGKGPGTERFYKAKPIEQGLEEKLEADEINNSGYKDISEEEIE